MIRITDIEFDFEDSQGELPYDVKSLMMLCQSPGMLLTMKIS